MHGDHDHDHDHDQRAGPEPPDGPFLHPFARSVLSRIVRATFPASGKTLALHLLLLLDEALAAGDDPTAEDGWVTLDRQDVERQLGIPGSRQTVLLEEMKTLGVLENHPRSVRLWRFGAEWAGEVFDRKAAKAKATREGAGALPVRAELPASEPFYKSPTDKRLLPWNNREAIIAAVTADGRPVELAERIWAFVGHFQSSTKETFKGQWIRQVYAAIDEGYSPEMMAMTLTEMMAFYRSRNKPVTAPLGCLMRTLRNYRHDLKPTGKGTGAATPATSPRRPSERQPERGPTRGTTAAPAREQRGAPPAPTAPTTTSPAAGRRTAVPDVAGAVEALQRSGEREPAPAATSALPRRRLSPLEAIAAARGAGPDDDVDPDGGDIGDDDGGR